MSDIRYANKKLSQNLVGLCAFDLVARHGNFTGAAEALGITQSAVSQRIKALELDLGVSLFRREHRGVVLTNEGSRLLGVVGPAMHQMRGSVVSLIERKARPRVRISADFAFSTFWLLPRISELRAEFGDDLELQILASQIPPEEDDDCDLSIHVRPFDQIGPDDILLLEEKVAAVCSPDYLARNGPIEGSEKLLSLQLLSLSRPPSAHWQTWQNWFKALGIVGERSQNYISFNNYDMVTQSAVAGGGIALGWLGLVDDLLRKGQLVQATPDVVSSAAGYVMSPGKTTLSRDTERILTWITEQAGGGSGRVAVD